MDSPNLKWQSKLILLLVIAPVAVNVAWQTRFWLAHETHVAAWALGLSALLGLLAWKSGSGTPAAAATGALICASMMYSTFVLPYQPWRTAIVPILAVLVLTSLATRFGLKSKAALGTAEEKHGRNAAQVCANLGFAALVYTPAVSSLLRDHILHLQTPVAGDLWLTIAAFASLAEAAADTVSSEIGQVLGGQPYLLTNFRRVAPGTDGAISRTGTLAGTLAAVVVAAIGIASTGLWARNYSWIVVLFISAGGIFGLLFDSLLGATLERRGWLNNDAVNFLSTASAAMFVIVIFDLVLIVVIATGGFQM